MVNGGLTQVQVTKQLKIGPRTLPQTLDGSRPPRTNAGESRGQREEGGHESHDKKCRVEVPAYTAPVNEEAGAQTNCEAASRLQVGRVPLFAALPATEAAETAQAAQTDGSTVIDTAGLRASSPQVVH